MFWLPFPLAFASSPLSYPLAELPFYSRPFTCVSSIPILESLVAAFYLIALTTWYTFLSSSTKISCTSQNFFSISLTLLSLNLNVLIFEFTRFNCSFIALMTISFDSRCCLIRSYSSLLSICLSKTESLVKTMVLMSWKLYRKLFSASSWRATPWLTSCFRHERSNCNDWFYEVSSSTCFRFRSILEIFSRSKLWRLDASIWICLTTSDIAGELLDYDSSFDRIISFTFIFKLLSIFWIWSWTFSFVNWVYLMSSICACNSWIYPFCLKM